MATAVLYIGWYRPHPGRELDTFTYLADEARPLLDGWQAEGYFESQEHVGLTAHGCGPGGFVLLSGERHKLDELRRTDAFERFAMRLGSLVGDLAVVPGVNRAGMDAVRARNPFPPRS